MATTITKLLFRRGSDTDRQATTLSMGEPGWTATHKRLYVGDGVTLGGQPVPITDPRYLEWSTGSTDNSDHNDSDTTHTNDGMQFLTLNKAGLSGLLEQCFVPKVPTSFPNTLMGRVVITGTEDELLQIEGDLDVNGSADISENLMLHGTLHVDGVSTLASLDVEGDATISGDLIVTGNTVTQEDISTKDNKIVLNVENVGTVGGGPSNDTGNAVGTAALAGIYIKHVGGSVNDTGTSASSYFRVASDPYNLELKSPLGFELTLDIDSNSVYTAAGNLTVEDNSWINQDLTTNATGVNFGSITMGSGTIGCGAITSTAAIAGTSLNLGSGAIASGAITSNSVIQGTTITATTNFAGDLTGEVTGNASSATKLKTARTIGDVSFNGTANIVPKTTQIVAKNDNVWYHPTFVSDNNEQQHYIDHSSTTVAYNYRYNPSANTLGVRHIQASGDVTVTGNVNVSTQILLDKTQGTGAPAIAFTGDTNCGIFWQADNQIGIATGGSALGAFEHGKGWVGNVVGDVKASDASVMVDSSAKTFTGSLNGDVTGIHTGAVVGDVTGDVTADTIEVATRLKVGDGSMTLPSICFTDDTNTGFYQPNDGTNPANLGRIHVTTNSQDCGNFAAGRWNGDVHGDLTGDVTGDLTGKIQPYTHVDSPSDDASGEPHYLTFVQDADGPSKLEVQTKLPYDASTNTIGGGTPDVIFDGTHTGDGNSLNLSTNATITTLPSPVGGDAGKFLQSNGLSDSTWENVDAFPPYPAGNGILVGGGGSSGSTTWHNHVDPATTIDSQIRVDQQGYCIFYFGNSKTDNGAFLVRKGPSDASVATDYLELLYLDEEGTFKLRNGDDSTHNAGVLTLQNDVNGNLAVKGNVTAYYSFSDKNLKKNIKAIDSTQALEQVNSLQSVEFKWRDDHNSGNQIGLIAQEVEKIVPEVVSTRNRLDDTVEEGVKPYKHIEYEKLVPLLIESVKVLTNRIEELEARDK